ncbi:MAG: hypothetical protein JJE25_12210 [Bacteroidia bacterium]|nr:hypothetical protein [Bacteroidia bacterium]
MKKIFLIILLAPLVTFYSCKKGPGEGGQTTIAGKVWAEEWDDNTYTQHYDTLDRWAMDEDVYVIYGDDATYGDRMKTGPDGVFEFKYLREGDYTIYVYSGSIKPGKKEAVSKRVSIPDHGTYDAGKFTIKK